MTNIMRELIKIETTVVQDLYDNDLMDSTEYTEKLVLLNNIKNEAEYAYIEYMTQQHILNHYEV